jgi:hypothetical protein
MLNINKAHNLYSFPNVAIIIKIWNNGMVRQCKGTWDLAEVKRSAGRK